MDKLKEEIKGILCNTIKSYDPFLTAQTNCLTGIDDAVHYISKLIERERIGAVNKTINLCGDLALSISKDLDKDSFHCEDCKFCIDNSVEIPHPKGFIIHQWKCEKHNLGVSLEWKSIVKCKDLVPKEAPNE